MLFRSLYAKFPAAGKVAEFMTRERIRSSKIPKGDSELDIPSDDNRISDYESVSAEETTDEDASADEETDNCESGINE